MLHAERDWTQQDLADRAGVSRQTNHSIEAGMYDPGLPLAFTLGRLFGLAVEQIFEPEDQRR